MVLALFPKSRPLKYMVRFFAGQELNHCYTSRENLTQYYLTPYSMLGQFVHSEHHRTWRKDSKRGGLHTPIEKEESRGGRDGHWITTRAVWSSAIAVTTISLANSWAPFSQFEVVNMSWAVPDHVWLKISELHLFVATCAHVAQFSFLLSLTCWILERMLVSGYI